MATVGELEGTRWYTTSLGLARSISLWTLPVKVDLDGWATAVHRLHMGGMNMGAKLVVHVQNS